jgi:hypothetical protein
MAYFWFGSISENRMKQVSNTQLVLLSDQMTFMILLLIWSKKERKPVLKFMYTGFRF